MATTTGNHVYITWWSNKTGNDEVMFKASKEPVMRVSNDNGKTFGEKIMLSNSATTAKQ